MPTDAPDQRPSSDEGAERPVVPTSVTNNDAHARSETPSPHSSGTSSPSIPEHELLRRIGGGSYGEVWLARNKMGSYHAVKIVHRGTFEDHRPFEREYSGIQKFEPISRSHEGLVDLLQVGRNDQHGYFYYVMELADGAENPKSGIRNPKEAQNPNDETGSPIAALRTSDFGLGTSFDIRHSSLYSPRTLKLDLSRRGSLPFDECVRLGLALASALAHLHKHGLVHRDIKPSNIIFIGGAPKLADIGLVTDVDATRSYVGTEGFMPPEGPGTPQADLYSLGKVLYEMATGKDRQEYPDLPTALRASTEREPLLELNEIFTKACATDPHLRYQTAEELVADLALLQGGKSIKRLRTLERRLAAVTKIGLATAALLLIASVAYLFAVSQARRAERERRHSDQLLYAADMSAAQQALEAGNLVSATTLLEAHRPGPKSATEQDLRGFEWYYLKNLCRGDEAHTFRGHIGAVKCVALSPDGKLLASCGDDASIKLCDLSSKTNLATLQGHAGAVNAIAFSPDGRTLASGGDDKTVKLWNIATRAVVVEFTNHAEAVISIAFSPDGKRLAVGEDGPTARLWEVASGQEVQAFNAPSSTTALAVSSDGHWLAIGDVLFGLRLWDLSTMQQTPDLYEEAGQVWGLAFSPDSEVLAATRSDGVVLWDLAQRRVVGKLKGHEGEVQPVVFSRDGKFLATGSGDTTVRLWDFASRQLLRILKGHNGWVNSVAFSPDGQTLFSGSVDQTVKVWDLSLRGEPDVLRGHGDSVICVAFSPDDRLLASTSLDGTVKLWDVARGANVATLTGHTAAVTGVTFSLDGAVLVSCSLDETVRLWDLTSRASVATLPAGKRLACLSLSPDGRTLATGSGWWDESGSPSEVIFWDLQSRQRLKNEVEVHGMVRTLSYSPDGKTLAVGIVDSLELLDVASKRAKLISTNLNEVMAWSPQGNTFFAANRADGDHVAALDFATLRISGRLQIPGGAGRYMVCSPDGKTLAVFYATARIKLCNVASGREVATLPGHETFGMHLAFSHDGQTLASPSSDRTIRLWRAPRE